MKIKDKERQDGGAVKMASIKQRERLDVKIVTNEVDEQEKDEREKEELKREKDKKKERNKIFKHYEEKTDKREIRSKSEIKI